MDRWQGELSTGECTHLLDQFADMTMDSARRGPAIVILSGGEPLLRSDVFEIARHGSSCGLRVALATCGETLYAGSAAALVDAGVSRISLSLDGPDAESHDAFRGVGGSYESVIAAMKIASEAGLEFQVNTTATRLNIDDMPGIHRAAIERGAVAHDIFFLVPTGRATELAEIALSPRQQEEALEWIARTSESSPILIKPTCAPQYARIARAHGGGLAGRNHGGCIGGTGFVFVSHIGNVQACGFLDHSAGSIREQGLATIWNESPFLGEIRDVDSFSGKCGACPHRRACRGCRARALAMTGSHKGSDPLCDYTPPGYEEDNADGI